MRDQKPLLISTLALVLAAVSFQAACNKSQGATDGGGSQPAPGLLDPTRCFDHVKAQVEIGPRPSGSTGIEKLREYIKSQMKNFGHKTETDRFVANTRRGPIEMLNLRTEIEGASKNICIFMAHYDTKRIFNGNFIGANDGASGVAVLLEIARYYSPNGKEKPPMSLRILFVDGEEVQTSASLVDARSDWDDTNTLWGSRHEVERIKKDPKEFERVKVVILADMVGDKNLNIQEETLYSHKRAIGWVREAAAEAGLSKYFFQHAGPAVDDHRPFYEAGIPDVVDLIDFDYGPGNAFWHSDKDTIDKVSADSLRITGDVMIRALAKAAKQWP